MSSKTTTTSRTSRTDIEIPMMTNFLLDLPELYTADILSTWLGVTDLSHLDVAYCSNSQRLPFLAIFTRVHSNGVDNFNENTWKSPNSATQFLLWLAVRRCSVKSITLTSHIAMLRDQLLNRLGPYAKSISFTNDWEANQLIPFMYHLSQHFRSLERVDMTEISMVDMSLAILLTCPGNQLLSLNLIDSSISDSGLFAVASQCPGLKELELGRCRGVTNGGVVAIAHSCSQLELLGIEQTRTTEAALLEVAHHCPHLESIFGRLTDLSLAELSRCCHQLSFVSSTAGTCTDHGVTQLVHNNKTLKLISFLACPGITDASMVAIAEHCNEHLMHLSVAMCDQVTDTGLSRVLSACTQLRVLILSKTAHVTATSLAAVAKHGMCLKQLCLMGQHTFPERAILEAVRGCAVTLKVVMLSDQYNSKLEKLRRECAKLGVHLRMNNVVDARL